MSVAVLHIFEYQGNISIAGPIMASTSIVLSKVEEGGVRVVELLNNVHRMAEFYDWNERCAVLHSVIEQRSSVITAVSFIILGRAPEYLPHLFSLE